MKYIIKTGVDKGSNSSSNKYLGTWCISRPCNQRLEEINIEPYMWEDKDLFHNHAQYIDKKTTNLFPVFVAVMNEIHRENLSVRYWEILLKYWFICYVATFYDRYLNIKRYEQEDERIITNNISVENFVVPNGLNDCQDLLSQDDLFNEQLFAQIIKPNINGEFNYNLNTYPETVPRVGLKKKIILSGLYCDHEAAVSIKQILGKKCKILHFDANIEKSLKNVGVCQKRKIFISVAEGMSNEFERSLFKSLAINTPKFFIEVFTFIRKKLLNDIVLPKLYVTNNHHYSMPTAKLLMAEVIQNGGKIIWGQHGSGANTKYLQSTENWERKVPDKYIAWGWAKIKQNKILNLPSINLSSIQKNISCKISNGPLLLISTNAPKYFFRFQNTVQSTDIVKYSQMQINFINNLRSDIRHKMNYRPYFNDYGQGILDKIQEINPQMGIITGGNVIQAYDSHRLIVVDHCTSTIGSLMASNKPCLFFWDKKINRANAKTDEIFKNLNEVGILHDTPESASEYINNIYENTEKWWYQDQVQNAKKQFVNNYALCTDNYKSLWADAINKVYDDC